MYSKVTWVQSFQKVIQHFFQSIKWITFVDRHDLVRFSSLAACKARLISTSSSPGFLIILLFLPLLTVIRCGDIPNPSEVVMLYTFQNIGIIQKRFAHALKRYYSMNSILVFTIELQPIVINLHSIAQSFPVGLLQNLHVKLHPTATIHMLSSSFRSESIHPLRCYRHAGAITFLIVRSLLFLKSVDLYRVDRKGAASVFQTLRWFVIDPRVPCTFHPQPFPIPCFALNACSPVVWTNWDFFKALIERISLAGVDIVGTDSECWSVAWSCLVAWCIMEAGKGSQNAIASFNA